MNKVVKFLLVTAAILVPLALIGGAVAATNSYEETEEQNHIPITSCNVSKVTTNEVTLDYTIKKANFIQSYDDNVTDEIYRIFIINAINMDDYDSYVPKETGEVKSIKNFIRATKDILNNDPSIVKTTTEDKYSYVTTVEDQDTIAEDFYETMKFSVTISDLKPETNYAFAIEFYYLDINSNIVKGYNLNDMIYIKSQTKKLEGN